MTDRIEVGGLQVARELHDFVVEEALPGTGLEADGFWDAFGDMLRALTPRNRELLGVREEMQGRIDAWLRDNDVADLDAYKAFLRDIGYLVPEGEAFSVETENVDPEIAAVAGPQLVVPVMNARYALNAANARWGSLYDALYGTDAMGTPPPAGPYNEERGAEVIAWARRFLDEHFPIHDASWQNVLGFQVDDQGLVFEIGGPERDTGTEHIGHLRFPDGFVAFQGDPGSPSSILLSHNGLRVDVIVDPASRIGSTDRAGIADVILESALTSIMDNEDSIAAVDAADKVAAYRNWLGLMRGDLADTFEKGGKRVTRRLNPPREYTAADGSPMHVKAQVLMLTRNVGHLMTNPAILVDGPNGKEEVFEGLMDAMLTVLCALHDTGNSHTDGRRVNSTHGSAYVVKPKMHGPDEVAFAVETFDLVEDALALPRNSVKMGIMDEERRTTVNLLECIRAARHRVVFINTGFLDRTGDEIHTSMEAGPMIRKGDMKGAAWIDAYERWNVDVGLAAGLRGRAQIGKGMWAMPDLMHAMLEQKIGHLRSGANTAWVPSPTAATLHATHYHQVDAHAVQDELTNRERASLDDILSVPVARRPNWTDADIQAEMDNNAQGILGYVVRWVDAGVGCSKVPDIDDVGLMEDRATCRISSQHMANWLHHGVVDEAQVRDTFMRMAKKVDAQNANDETYEPMSGREDTSIAYRAALDLVLEGREQPSGYTEPVLHRRRLEKKAA